MTKAPLVELEQEPILLIVAKKVQKGVLLTDCKGIPLSVVVDGANRHDKKLVKRTLDAIFFERPSTEDIIQNICMDKGYDFNDIRKLVEEYGYTAHIKSRGEENIRRDIPGFRAKRWVVERTHSWLNRFRRLLIRWEKKIENYLAILHLACALITFRSAGLFG